MDYKLLAIRRRDLTKASEMLLGLVTGMVADQQLHDLEIQLLRTWLDANSIVTTEWPGRVLAQRLDVILADGIITDAERQHLLETLQQFATSDFAETGSVTPEVLKLPLNDDAPIAFSGAVVCLTGAFIYGTRESCHEVTLRCGAELADTVTKKLRYLVVGTNVSPHWANTSYGRKIQKAVDLQSRGVPLHIISERRWMDCLGIAE